MTRKEAIALGLKRYSTGVPCAQGHLSDRNTRSSQCISCKDMYRNREKENLAKRLDRALNPEKYKEQERRKNKDKTRANKRRWYHKTYVKADRSWQQSLSIARKKIKEYQRQNHPAGAFKFRQFVRWLDSNEKYVEGQRYIHHIYCSAKPEFWLFRFKKYALRYGTAEYRRAAAERMRLYRYLKPRNRSAENEKRRKRAALQPMLARIYPNLFVGMSKDDRRAIVNECFRRGYLTKEDMQ